MNFEPQHVPPIICKFVEFKTAEIHIPDTPLYSNPLENWALLFIWAYYVTAKDKVLCKKSILQPIWEKHKHIYLSHMYMYTQIMYFQSQVFRLPFMFRKSTGFKYFPKILGGNYVFAVLVVLASTLQATLNT